jgi:putative ABC transport system permease protein
MFAIALKMLFHDRAKNLDTIFPLRDTELGRVRGVPGVDWAVPLYKSNVTIRTGNGELEASLLIGVDDSTLIGLPPEVVMGSIDDLRRPDAVAVSVDGFRKVWRNEPLSLGNIAELNDRRAVVVAILKDSPKFTSSITFFTRYSQALQYTNNGRNQMSFIVARMPPCLWSFKDQPWLQLRGKHLCCWINSAWSKTSSNIRTNFRVDNSSE